jgi:hypothetical protein
MTVYNSTHEVEWDRMGNGDFAKLLVEYEWDTEMNTLFISSVIYEGLEWIDYLNDITRNYITNYISERLEDDRE